MTDVNDVLADWEKQGVAFVRFELPDMHGISRSKTIPIAHAADYAERGLNMYGGTSVLDTRSDVVGGTLYHEEVGYGDQLLFPDPDSAAVLAVGRPDRAPHLRLAVARRDAPRGNAAERLPAGPGEVAVDGIRAAHRVRVRVLSPHRRHARAALRWLSDLQHAAERLRPDDPPDPRRDAAGGRGHHHRELRVLGIPVGDQLRAGSGSRRSRQRVHVQERREGDREAGRLPGDVHDEAVHRPGGQRLPHAHLAPARRLGRERVRRRRTTRRG